MSMWPVGGELFGGLQRYMDDHLNAPMSRGFYVALTGMGSDGHRVEMSARQFVKRLGGEATGEFEGFSLYVVKGAPAVDVRIAIYLEEGQEQPVLEIATDASGTYGSDVTASPGQWKWELVTR